MYTKTVTNGCYLLQKYCYIKCFKEKICILFCQRSKLVYKRILSFCREITQLFTIRKHYWMTNVLSSFYVTKIDKIPFQVQPT